MTLKPQSVPSSRRGSPWWGTTSARVRRARKARKTARRGHAGAQETVEALAVVLQGENAVEAARGSHAEQALGVLQYRLGEKAAIGEEAHGAAQRGGGSHEPLVGRWGVLPQASQEVADAFRIGRQ